MAGLGGALVVRQGNGSSAYSYGYTYLVSAVNSTLNLGAYVGFEVAGSGLQHGCSRVSTLGLWDDEVNWDTGVVPGPTDEVRKSNFTYGCRPFCSPYNWNVYGASCEHVKNIYYILGFRVGVTWIKNSCDVCKLIVHAENGNSVFALGMLSDAECTIPS